MNLGDRRRDVQDLYKQLTSLNMQKRLKVAKEPGTQNWLSLLTPSQLASLFPDYYKKQLPNMGLTLTAAGATTYAGRSPSLSGGTASQTASGTSSSSRGYSESGSSSSSFANVAQEDPNEAFTKILEKESGIKFEKKDPNAKVFGTLSEQRSKFGEELNATPDLKTRMAAMMISEVGLKADDESLRGIGETMANRASAQGKSLSWILERKTNAGGNYYEPYNNGHFDRNYNYLKSHPEDLARLNARIDEIIAGSNDSNLATDNGSAGVAANARKTQSIVKETTSGETLSRKDKPEYANLHGTQWTKNTQDWYNSTMQAMQAEENRKILENAGKIPEGDASQSGSVAEGSLRPGNIEPPANMSDATKKYWNSLKTDADKQTFLSITEKLGGIEKINALAAKSPKSGGVPQFNIDGLPIPQVGPMGKVNRFSSNKGLNPNPDLTKVNTAYGNINVDKSSAVAFSGFFDDLHKAGAPLKQPGSYNKRQKRWSNGWSEHAFGNAIDLDDQVDFSGAFKKWQTENPGKYEEIKQKWGIVQPLPQKDPAHHEFGGTISQEAYDQVTAMQNASGGKNAVQGAEQAFENIKRVNQLQSQKAAIRKGPLQDKLVGQLDYAANKTGVFVDVESGGQRMKEAPGHTGSHRHDQGGAADIKLYKMEDGRKRYLSMDNPEDRAIMQKFVNHAVQAGASGVGAGLNYMGADTMHIGGGRENSWGGADWIEQARQTGVQMRSDYQNQLKELQEQQRAAAASATATVQPVQSGSAAEGSLRPSAEVTPNNTAAPKTETPNVEPPKKEEARPPKEIQKDEKAKVPAPTASSPGNAAAGMEKKQEASASHERAMARVSNVSGASSHYGTA